MNENLEKYKALQIIGENIKRLRVSRNMTQEQLAERMERSINFVSLIELGKSGMSVVTILEICNILEVDVNCFFFYFLINYYYKIRYFCVCSSY